MKPRVARLFLVDREGAPLGVLPPLAIEVPWWQEVEPVVDCARQVFGLEFVVLRLLDVGESGGNCIVSYLAEAAKRPPDADDWPESRLDGHPLRAPYAEPGGPARDLRWVDGALARSGLRRTSAVQVRTWNLSSVWRIDCDHQRFWLKVVPPFFAHEPRVLEHLAPGPVPRLVARDGGRMLMEDCPGPDLYEAAGPILSEMVSVLVSLQVEQARRTADWLARGVPDGRLPGLQGPLAAVVLRHAADLTLAEQGALAALVDDLPRLHVELDACGIPDSLVHGDFHRGNVRGERGRLSILDWGDSFVGNPVFDLWVFLGRLPSAEVSAARARWSAEWEAAIPGSDPNRAAALLHPLAVARGALVYQGFLDQIEPSEHPYHRGDPLRALQSCAALLS